MKITGGPWTTGNCDERVLRGGSWFDDADRLRSSSRGSLSKSIRWRAIGIRVAREIDQ